MPPPPLDADDRAFVFAVVRRIVRSDDVAHDATQDALLRAHRFRDRFRGESAHRTWLYRIAVTTALGHQRTQQRAAGRLAADAPALADPQPSAPDALSVRQLAARARALLGSINAGMSRAFALKCEDASVDDIARELGISAGNVKIRMFRTRIWLRTQLAE